MTVEETLAGMTAADESPVQEAQAAEAEQAPAEAQAAPESPARETIASALDKLQGETQGAQEPEIVRPDGKTAAGAVGKEEPQAPEGKSEEKAPEAGAAKAQAEHGQKKEPDELEGASDKTRARFQQLAQERTQAQQQVQALREELTGAGFDNESFATVLEIGRRVSSSDPGDKRLALQMLDKIRENVAAELGEEVPGVDLLKDFPDLQKQVADMELTRGAALEVAKARRISLQQQEALAAQQAQFQAAQQQQQAVAGAQQAVQNTLYAHKNDVDFSARLSALQTFIRQGDNLQRISSQDPSTWAGTLELLYRNIGQIVAAAKQPAVPAPISARTLKRGVQELRADADPADKLLARMEQMGI